MTTMPDALIRQFDVSRESRVRLECYVALLLEWQARINLIGPSTVEAVWQRHVADGLQLVALLPRGTRVIADLGSGGGIPGLILAAATEAHVHLYESNGKKVAFLREALRRMGAKGTVHQRRIEDLAQAEGLPQATVVTARALAHLPLLLGYAAPFLTGGALGLFHKGQDVDAELTEATKSWKIKTRKHPSCTDSQAVILEVEEACHV
ncbi:MAG TPA: 16S rRNA (guanine(527)-N(7))-methyltransferase RsmG [Aestuariivirga sp.]|nr:16S rRNA (guanine(527)-N(7))-methyltransferase RsmG [Aestuariivirga sp.]